VEPKLRNWKTEME